VWVWAAPLVTVTSQVLGWNQEERKREGGDGLWTDQTTVVLELSRAEHKSPLKHRCVSSRANIVALACVRKGKRETGWEREVVDTIHDYDVWR
jgi:hypothetical protein